MLPTGALDEGSGRVFVCSFGLKAKVESVI